MKLIPLSLFVGLALVLLLAVAACAKDRAAHDGKVGASTRAALPAGAGDRVELTDAEWAARLTREEYRVLREQGTERAFTGDLWDHHDEGVYVCSGCGRPLFPSETKFESGTGWPSYFAPIEPAAVATTVDRAYGMTRTEVHCARCDGHLGHIFEDGPEPTGLRYCINSASLDFVPKGAAAPASLPTDSASPGPTDSASPAPMDSASPAPRDPASPAPADPAPSAPMDPAPSAPVDPASPAPAPTPTP